MFETTHKCKELEFANSINSGDIIIHYDNFGENDFKEWMSGYRELDVGEYEYTTIDTIGIKYCPYCGRKLILKEEI